MRRSKVLVLPIAAALVLSACGGDDSADGDADRGAADGVVSVYTEAPLEEVVAAVVDAFGEENPGTPVEVVTVDPAALAGAVENGDADVVVSAQTTIATLAEGRTSGSFGRSLAVIAVAAGNPAGIADLTAFAADSGHDTAVCSDDTAVGNFGEGVLANAGVTPDPDTVDSGCEAEVLQEIAAGDLDAGLMFRLGLAVPDGVELIVVEEDDNVIFDFGYVVASDEAADFADFLAADAVESILAEMGLLP